RIAERWPRDHVVFMGLDSAIEKRMLAGLGFEFKKVRAAPVVGRRGLGLVRAVLKNLFAVFGAVRAIVEAKPDRVVGIGGYVSVPVVLAAWLLRIPRVIFEPDAAGGRANRFLARFANTVFVAFESAKERYPEHKTYVVGPLVRKEFLDLGRWSADAKRGWFVLLLLGGSQGSHSLVKALAEALPHLVDLRDELFIFCQARAEDRAFIEERMSDHGFSGEVQTFFEHIWSLYSCATLVVSRAGANAIFELCFARKPAILVPYPHALGHQEANARQLVEIGAAEMIRDEDLSGKVLADRIRFYMRAPEVLQKMREAYGPPGFEDGAMKMAEIIRGR
ncbi:MAG TPA: UDP-N-acetylglucosamine--N-acetylmuramyl-(pentapeptide) pyrophosphoryl-undecaprenol N-acetylglucosamine transferase, partial [Proteobacteria bacterium]|nr:UDP-N-acetylglucosamine--N-acetylmuramyl-(pentapeptide) pyrophosphoryl-undecaprenol N-acetylglucosamine transferase [Pseudomonadota bacterium]